VEAINSEACPPSPCFRSPAGECLRKIVGDVTADAVFIGTRRHTRLLTTISWFFLRNFKGPLGNIDLFHFLIFLTGFECYRGTVQYVGELMKLLDVPSMQVCVRKLTKVFQLVDRQGVKTFEQVVFLRDY
jgi:hypothetical protein